MKSSKNSSGPAIIGASLEARKLASVILEVLAGMHNTTEAAELLQVSLPRYYSLELRAINGLIAACEPKPKGRIQTHSAKIALLEKELTRLRNECSRQQALLRTTQRTVGLSTRIKPGKNGGKKRRKSKPRSLKVVGMLKKQDEKEQPATS